MQDTCPVRFYYLTGRTLTGESLNLTAPDWVTATALWHANWERTLTMTLWRMAPARQRVWRKHRRECEATAAQSARARAERTRAAHQYAVRPPVDGDDRAALNID